MGDNFIIRKANIKDLKDVLLLNLELFKKEYREFDKSLNLNWTHREGKKYCKNRIIKKDGFVEIIEHKGRIIGCCVGGIIKGLSYRKKAKYAELENIFIEKNFRGKGLGIKLTRDFINWCKKNKINYVSLKTYAKNRSAINFYRNLGFKDYNLILERHLLPERSEGSR